MAKSDLEKFERRLGLAAYFMHLFGVSDPTDEREVRSLLEALNKLKEGYDGERSEVAKYLSARQGCGIPAVRLFEYDSNIREHVAKLNQHRDRPITLKYFQVLAALCSEIYLDRVTREPEKFRHDINVFIRQENEGRPYYEEYTPFEPGGLNKLAYWMATGSGKTLLMHINYYQWQHYADRLREPMDNILLLTPNSGLSRQHIKEMRMSGIPCRHFHEPDQGRRDVVQVLEIYNLFDDASGTGKRVDPATFEGRNLLFVDEGHKGVSGDGWMASREQMAREGFAFEYSATFGQAMYNASMPVQQAYGQAIAFNYSYPYFYEDGYGKDYHILNLKKDVDRQLTDRYLLANLLTFVEQKLCWAHDPDTARREYNIAEPLLIFVGNSVTAGKTLGSLTTNEDRSLTDVQKLVVFLDRVLRNDDGWVAESIDAILSRQSGLLREDGTDLFENVFSYLKKLREDHGWDGARIYDEMLEGVFHTDASAPLHLVNLQSADGELGLRAGSTDRYFGVIDIGNERAFLSLAEEELDEVATDEDVMTDSLFQDINQQGSDVQILLGSRKFIEGWSSWRVSAMGLMNFGQSPGPMIIQLFGRGVRLLGKNQSLKRSRELEGASPDHIQRLETLHIFGVRAKYMSEFRKYLEREGIDVEEWEEVGFEVPVRNLDNFEDKGLVTPRIEVPKGARFGDETLVQFQTERAFAPTVDLRVNVEDIDSSAPDLQLAGGRGENTQHIPNTVAMMLDWRTLEARVWQHARAKGYDNLVMSRADMQRIIEPPGYFRLHCPDSMLRVDTAEDMRRIERIAAMILTKYVDNLYSHARKEWEDQQRNLSPVDADDPNIPAAIKARYRRDSEVKERLDQLETMLTEAPDALFEDDGVLPPRVHFDSHLYAPLLLDNEAARAEGLGDQLVLQFTPTGLNKGEVQFVRALANFTRSDMGAKLLQDYELYLLRNQSRGAGVAFSVQPVPGAAFEQVYPDFIVWLKSDDLQHIIFIDPHGLTHAGNLFRDAKVCLHESIKHDQHLLAAQTGRDDVHLHSFVVSTTTTDKLPNPYTDKEFDELREAGVYFPDREANYLSDLLGRVVENQTPSEAPQVPDAEEV